MSYDILHETKQRKQAHQRQKRWLRVVSGMAAVVVFCTTYALILPAITLDKNAACGFEEHQHEESCYAIPDIQQLTCAPTADLVVHTHDERCVDPAGNQSCTLAEVFAHTHGDDCYDEQTVYLCGLEPGEGYHTHTADCYRTEDLTCELPEQEAHTHSDSCYTVSSDLICQLKEVESHAHGEGCYESVSELVCTQPEGEDHTHEESCYTTGSDLICQLEESSEFHAHGEDCYESTSELSCTLPECEESHAHAAACYALSEEVLCGIEESEGHVHDDTCPTEVQDILTCTLQEIIIHDHSANCTIENCSGQTVAEHIHTEECPVEVIPGTVSVLTCGMEQHTHEDACYPAEETIPEVDEVVSKYLCESGQHTHGEACYDENGSLTCTVPQHTHGASCLIEDVDLTADVETAEQWEATFADVELTGNWAADALTIAETQLGYTESAKNVILVGDKTLKGYTRYGDWYGDHYGDWCAMFVSFCLDYAGAEDYPLAAGCSGWIAALQEQGVYYNYNEYTPKPGDIIFFDWEQRSPGEVEVVSDHVGMVAELITDESGKLVQIKAIEGNSGDRVQYVTYDLTDEAIIGYGYVPEGNITTQVYEGEDYTVTVSYGVDAKIPANAQLAVNEILPGTEEYDTYYQQSVDTLLGTDEADETAESEDPAEPAEETEEEVPGITFARFFDIGFTVNGESIEPAAPVDIQIQYHESIEMAENLSSVAVHFAESGIEVLNAAASRTEDGLVDSFQFTQDSFSVTGIVGYAARAGSGCPTVALDQIELASRSKAYVLFTQSGDNYYAIDGNGNAVQINVDEDSNVTSAIAPSLLWSFAIRSDNSYDIQNYSTNRYLHTYKNDSGSGVTTATNWGITVTPTDNPQNGLNITSYNFYPNLDGTSFVPGTSQTVFYAAEYELNIPENAYIVWFDGTCGDLMSYYGSPNGSLEGGTYSEWPLAVSRNQNKITLPSDWKSPSKYEYKLQGWYDIYNAKYYEPGATDVEITQNTVFYADWLPASYNLVNENASNNHLIANHLDTSDFITTRVFDYTIMFNVMSTDLEDSSSISYFSHNDNWKLVKSGNVDYKNGANQGQSLDFIFLDYDPDGSISMPSGRDPHNVNQAYISSGIINHVIDISNGRLIHGMLFNKDTSFYPYKGESSTAVIGKNFVGSGNYLYQYMDATTANYDGLHDGYYYYDSAINAAAYDKNDGASDGRFYLMDHVERTTDSQGGNNHGGFSDFLPFNAVEKFETDSTGQLGGYTSSGMPVWLYDAIQLRNDNANNGQGTDLSTLSVNDTIAPDYYPDNAHGYQYDAKDTSKGSEYTNAGTNYLFGISSLFDFYLPNDTNEHDEYGRTGNRSIKGDEMIFEFKGDDDVWIFIDENLAVDIGGVHGIESGYINLSTGKLHTSGVGSTDQEVNQTIDLDAGQHRISIMYMERGSSQSNCAIYFNLSPRFALQLMKQDHLTQKALTGAKFSFFMDAACTKPAELWDNVDAFNQELQNKNAVAAGEEYEKLSKNTFAVDETGVLNCWGIVQGETYYIKEVAPPTGYSASDDVIRITTSNNGTANIYGSVLAGNDGTKTEGFGVKTVSLQEDIHLVQLTVDNQDQEYVDLNVTKTWAADTDRELIPDEITVYLTVNGVKDESKSLTLTKAGNWTGSWSNLPKYSTSTDPNTNITTKTEITYSVKEGTVAGFTSKVGTVTPVETSFTKLVNSTELVKDQTYLLVSPAGALTHDAKGYLDWQPDVERAATDPSAQWKAVSTNDGFILTSNANRSLYLSNGYFMASDENRTPMNFSSSVLYNDSTQFGIFYDNDGNTEDEGHLYFARATTTDPVSFELYQLSTETKVTGYEVSIENTPVDETTSLTVTKAWADADTVDHSNDTVTVRLYADGVATELTATLSAASNPAWTATFDNLALYQEGTKTLIKYSVAEDPINRYKASYPNPSAVVLCTDTSGQQAKEKIMEVTIVKNIKRISAAILCLLTVILLLPTAVLAAGPIDTGAEANLTLTLTPDGVPAEGVEFRLYRVATVSSSVEFTLTDTFSKYPISVADPTAESWRYLTAMLPGYIAADQVKPDYTKKTDEDGIVTFENISTGLYLVMGDVYHGNRQYISPTPFLVSLPNRNDDDTWAYDVSVANKYTAAPDSEDVDIEVLKVWNDNKNADRPKEVTIELYDGTTLYETVILNKSNNWQHKWENLYGGTTWSIKEREVPKGYKASIEQQGNRFVVTNTKPCPPQKPPEKLPQTGVLWWPVPVLMACGLMLVLMGLIRRRGTRYEK